MNRKISNILIVCNSDNTISKIDDYFQLKDVNVGHSRTYNEAVINCDENDYAVIVIDIGDEGIKLFKDLKTKIKLERVQIILVSADMNKDFEDIRNHSLYSFDIMSSPFLPEMLMAKIDFFIELDNLKIENSYLSKQMIENSRLASIGSLVPGIVHEVNNPLAGILGMAQLLDGKVGEDKNQLKIQKILEMGKRLSDTLNHVKKLSYASESDEWFRTDLNEVVKKSISLIQEQMVKHNIKVEIEYFKDLPAISGQEQMLEMLVHQLLINAKESFELDPTVSSREIRIKLDFKDGQVKLIYFDNATSIIDENENKLKGKCKFSKNAHLALVCNIINEHKGEMHFLDEDEDEDEDENKNKDFRILEIIFNKFEEALTQTSIDFNDTKTKKLFIVDDEDIIIEVLEDFLSIYFDVTTFIDSEEALKEIQKKQYDIILTDLKMPKFTGMDIMKASRELSPEKPVIIMSGFARDEGMMKNVRDQGARDILTKPFMDLDALVARLQSHVR